ncbi:MAG: DUF4340 domain-containing protein [Steroidobacteraceae bacterium]
MTLQRFLLILAAAILAIAGAMYLSSLPHLDRDPRGGLFLPALAAQLDSITEIRLRKAGDKPGATLRRLGPGRWVVAERNDYPADLGKIRKLLLALSEAKVIEPKTSNAASYAVLGVEDTAAPGAGGTAVTLVSPAKTSTVIIGKPAGNGNYARRAGEAPSYSVEPGIPVESETRDWIDGKLLEVAPERIQGVRMKLADGGSYRIGRIADAAAGKTPGAASPAPAAKPESDTAGFRLEAVPPGREAADAATLAPSPTTYSGVPADDVAPAASIDFSKPSIAELELNDGSILTITGVVAGEKHWVMLHSSKDAALNTRSEGRAYELPGYRYDAVFRPLEQLLKPKPAKPAPASKPSAKRPVAGPKPPSSTP